MKKSQAYPIRVRFAKDIVAEIILPPKQTGRVAILALGLPSLPDKEGVLRFLAAQGYVAILPRYRGTWESEGSFLEKSPAIDIADIIDELGKKYEARDLFTGKTHALRVSIIHLFGSSFGGPAVLLNSHLPLVKKVIALSPVLDWKGEGEGESFSFFVRFSQEAFGAAYRPKHPRDWQKLIETDFYNPLQKFEMIIGRKVFILHTTDDTTIPYQSLISFADMTNVQYYLKPRGGHLSLGALTSAFYWKKISAFLSEK